MRETFTILMLFSKAYIIKNQKSNKCWIKWAFALFYNQMSSSFWKRNNIWVTPSKNMKHFQILMMMMTMMYPEAGFTYCRRPVIFFFQGTCFCGIFPSDCGHWNRDVDAEQQLLPHCCINQLHLITETEWLQFPVKASKGRHLSSMMYGVNFVTIFFQAKFCFLNVNKIK